MNGLTCGHMLGNLIAEYAREEARLKLLPFRCPVCDARTNHDGPHWTKDGSAMCGSKPVWASDLPEVKS